MQNTEYTRKDLEGMGNAQLWQLAREMGISKDGKRPELIARILEAQEKGVGEAGKMGETHEAVVQTGPVPQSEPSNEPADEVFPPEESEQVETLAGKPVTPSPEPEKPETKGLTAVEKRNQEVVEAAREDARRAQAVNAPQPTNIPLQEDGKGPHTTAVVMMPNGYEFRRYTKEAHGSKFKKLAEQFVEDRPGYTVRYE